MLEATAICVHGPPIDGGVWQRLSWRACSIQWQLANEGLAFIQQTIAAVQGVDHAILKFLLQEEVRTHWCDTVRVKAAEVLEMLPEIEAAVPRVLAVDKWKRIREAARANYPEDDFGGRKKEQK
jgi:hypothetical protein